MSETTIPPPRDETVDDMAERLAKQLYSNREMRKALALERDRNYPVIAIRATAQRWATRNGSNHTQSDGDVDFFG